jgi:antagonist of KipI
MSIKILHKGLADSLQDNGRYGFQHLGIPPNGCMDILSASLANYILQNEINTPVVELHFPSSQFQFLEDAIICVTGANFVPVINEKSIALHTPIRVQKNDVLSMLQPLEGCIAYLAIKGTYDAPLWLNSHSYNATRLNTNDLLSFSAAESYDANTANQLNDVLNLELIEKIQTNLFSNNTPIRILPGPAWQDLSPTAINELMSSSFTISTQRNRMGYHLLGPPLNLNIPNAYLSSAVTMGTLQLLPNGNVIVLMADHQTIGGYANLAQIILVDLPRFAQMKSGVSFKLNITNLETAQTLYKEMYAPFKY